MWKWTEGIKTVWPVLLFMFAVWAMGMISMGLARKQSSLTDESSGGLGHATPHFVDQSVHNVDGTLEGYAIRDGLDIYWAGRSNTGTNPLAVINVTIERLEFEQTTDLASNGRAKALVALMQARDALAGIEPTAMEDGTPIID